MLYSIIIVITTLIPAINTAINITFKLKINDFNTRNFIELVVSYFVKFLIPYLIMVTLNIKVILRLRQSRRRAGLNNLARQTNQTNSASDKGARFTITSILMDLFFLIFNLPDAIVSSYSMFYYNFIYIKVISEPVFQICFNFAPLLSFSYSAVLVIMFLIFNRIFRKELVIFFRLDKLVDIISPNFLNSSSNRV